MVYTKENIKEGIIAKINALDDYSEDSKRVFRSILMDYPIEVEQNVLEWINDLPITEVDCHGDSIKRVMDVFNLDISWFPVVLNNFIRFKNVNFCMTTVIYENLNFEGIANE